jgi:hypothetical protein
MDTPFAYIWQVKCCKRISENVSEYDSLHIVYGGDVDFIISNLVNLLYERSAFLHDNAPVPMELQLLIFLSRKTSDGP